jgi:hypothetical protein
MLISDWYYLKTKYRARQFVNITKLACNLERKFPWIYIGNNILEATTKTLVKNYTFDVSMMIFSDIEIYTSTCTNTQAHAYALDNWSNCQKKFKGNILLNI